MKIWHKASIGLIVFSIFSSGCEFPRSYSTLFHSGISPISPEMGYSFMNRYQTVNDLTPELKWKDLKKGAQTYDVGIWEMPYRSQDDVEKKSEQVESSWGTVVLVVTNVPVNSYQVVAALKPETYYNWSVRIRDGDEVRKWSSFSQQRAVLNVVYTHSDVPFGFKTPAK
jgi:hypothetical protein